MPTNSGEFRNFFGPIDFIEHFQFLQMPRKDRSSSWSGRPLWMEVAEVKIHSNELCVFVKIN